MAAVIKTTKNSTSKSRKNSKTKKEIETVDVSALTISPIYELNKCVQLDWKNYGFKNVGYICCNINFWRELKGENPKRYNWNEGEGKDIKGGIYWTSTYIKNEEYKKVYRLYVLPNDHPALLQICKNCKPRVKKEDLEDPGLCVLGCFDLADNQLP